MLLTDPAYRIDLPRTCRMILVRVEKLDYFEAY